MIGFFVLWDHEKSTDTYNIMSFPNQKHSSEVIESTL